MTKKAKASPKAAEDLLSQFVNAARQRYETDEKLELEKGVDIEVAGVGTFTILRTTQRNKKWVEAVRKCYAAHMDTKDEDILRDLEIGVFADTIIIGMKTAAGDTVPYDDKAKAAVKSLLKDTPDLFELLRMKANDSANFLKAYEAEEKN